ncbi:MAG TPA: M28 family peptidase [Methylomirabilota bacterium]|nr:M28 family peptidase [Methylomirabilota bacterium]
MNLRKTFLATLYLLAAAAIALAQGEDAFLSSTRQLTFDGKRSGEGYFSPDGKALIFQSEREADNPFYQIYVLDLETGDTTRVSPGAGKTTCGFFRFGSDEVLFASTHLDPGAREKQKAEFEFRATGKERRYSWDYDDQMDIFIAGRDGSNLRRVTSATGYDAEGAFSPDGKRIVFCSLRNAYPTNQLSAADLKRLETDPAYFGEIYIMNADGSAAQRLTHSPGYDGGPFFSPDGERIVWRHFETNGVVADVYTMKLDGSDVRRLTDFGCMSWAPMFYPSGEYLVFTANKLGFANFELYVVDARGEREPARVTYTDGFDGLPSFSPDGKQLTWTSNRGTENKSQLFIANWNHDAARRALAAAPVRTSTNAAIQVAQPTSATNGPATHASSLQRLSNDVVYLASPKLEGRMTGSLGAREAAEFIAAQLKATRVESAGEARSYFQPFSFNAGVRMLTNDNALTLLTNRETPATFFNIKTDFRPLSFTSNGTAAGEVVFVGYGLVVPGKAGEGYDSYAGLNVSNKVVLALRYVPEDVDAQRRQELNRYAGLRYKAMLARERGAAAILFVTGPNSPNAGDLAALASDSTSGGSGIIAVSVTTNVTAPMFAARGKELKTIQSQLDKEDPHAEGSFVLSNVSASVTAAVKQLKRTDRNVLGSLPAMVGRGVLTAPPTGDTTTRRAEDTAPDQPLQEFILVGAHYDHLGFGEGGAMLRSGEDNKIHPGADDNASGAAVVLELARLLADEQHRNPALLQRGVVFAFWSGEELGVLGSSHFAEHPTVPLSNIVAYINFDMVGRLRDKKLMLQGVGSSSAWRRWIERRNVSAGFSAVLQEDPYLPTDVTAFYPRGIPVLSFFTGSHDDYHRPTDTADKVNYDGVERIVKFARGLILDAANAPQRPDYLKVATSDKGGGSRENLRAYLGTIPDYATEVQGVKLSGVRGGSPAEKAGLQSGDIIVEFAGQKIANIYDYTYALDAVKIGQAMDIVVMRNGQRVSIKATPEARK